MDINEIKKEVYSNYMQAAYTMMSSDEYKKYRKKHIWIFISIFLIMIAVCFLSIKYILIPSILVEVHSRHVKKLVGYIWVITFFVLYAPFYLHNSYYSDSIKIRCMKKIIPDLLNIRYYLEEPKEESCVLPDSELKNSNIVKDYDDKSIDDIFFGNYNGIEFNIQEIELTKNRENLLSENSTTVEFDGMVLKADVNTGINGWIEIKTKETDKIMIFSFPYYFVTMCIIISFGLSFVLFLFFYSGKIPFCDSNFSCIIAAIVSSIILSIIPSLIYAKQCCKKNVKKLYLEQKDQHLSTFEEINTQFIIKASDNIDHIDEIVTPEFASVLNELKNLYRTNYIKCKFCNDKIILAIKSKENLFEIGNFYIPPTNKKVAERFVSQISGIILFLDYISNINKKSSI